MKLRDVDVWRKSLAATRTTSQDKGKAPNQHCSALLSSAQPRSASTLNRDITPHRAALNLALKKSSAGTGGRRFISAHFMFLRARPGAAPVKSKAVKFPNGRTAAQLLNTLGRVGVVARRRAA